MSKPFSWYPRYPLDYALDTINLSLMEHGAYALLLDHYYVTGGLPADKDTLHRICRAKGRYEKGAVDVVIDTYFVHDRDSRLSHKRVEDELAKRKTISESRSHASKCRTFDKQVMGNSSSNADTAQHSTETKNQKLSREDELIWKDGIDYLVDGGMKKEQARKTLGLLLRRHGPVALADAVTTSAVKNPTGNRVGYLQAVLQGNKRDAGSGSDIPHGML